VGTLQIGNGTTGSIDAASAVSTASGATLALNLANNASLTNAIANEGTVNATGANTNTLSGVISGAGGLTQSGSGTTILSNVNTYSGTTTMSNGQLHFAAGQTNTATINVGKASGSLGSYTLGTNSFSSPNAAVLSAATGVALGSASSTVTIGSGGVGILAPGNNLGADNGRLNINKDLVVNTGSMLDLGITTPTVATPTSFVFTLGKYYLASDTDLATAYDNVFKLITDNSNASPPALNTAVATEINVVPASGNHDFISVAGGLTLNGGSKVHVFANGTPTIAYNYGQVFNLIDWNSFSIIGAFDAGNDFYLPDLTSSNLAWDTSAFTTYGIIVIVPEPSRMLLLMFGLLGLFFRRRRRSGI
jgi:autotransporter-associated beta strand protein